MKNIHILERRLNKARVSHLVSLANESDLFNVVANVEEADIGIVSDSNGSEIVDYLIKKKKLSFDSMQRKSFPQFVNIDWFTACIKEKSLISTSNYIIILQFDDDKSTSSEVCDNRSGRNIDQVPNKKFKESAVSHIVAKYACQLAASVNHKNKKLCDALELLELHAVYRGDQNAESRALAFRRGSASLKSCGKEVTDEKDLINLPYIGQTYSSKAGHCKKVIMELLTEGFSNEVEDVIHSKFFQTIKKFCGIFGVGPVTARKWYYDLHLRTLDDVKIAKINLTQDQLYGLEHYDDLNTPVTIAEANYMQQLVENTCRAIDKNLQVILTGGFRRGKSEGHDIDLLISKPNFVKIENVLTEIINALQDHFIYTDKKAITAHKNTQKVVKNTTMDHFDKCFSIFKFKKEWLNVTGSAKSWKAIRVDLVVIPEEQFAFALLGWTGTKHFEREIRRYARAEKKIVLTSHGMYSLDNNEPITASSEEEIFHKLDLIYRTPSERCF